MNKFLACSYRVPNGDWECTIATGDEFEFDENEGAFLDVKASIVEDLTEEGVDSEVEFRFEVWCPINGEAEDISRWILEYDGEAQCFWTADDCLNFIAQHRICPTSILKVTRVHTYGNEIIKLKQPKKRSK